MGPAVPDVEENKLLRTVECLKKKKKPSGEMPQQDDPPSEKNSFDLRKDKAAQGD